MKLAFIGGGNMASALISGLLRAGIPPENIRVAEPSEPARQRLESEFGVVTHATAGAAIAHADTIILAVKPQVMPVVLSQLSGITRPEQLLVSIAAGIEIRTIQQALGETCAVIRAMPNTPALIGKGITGLFAAAVCNGEQRKTAGNIMSAAGSVVWVESESLINVVTAVSGSGPAYYFLLTEALREAGHALGLPEDTAAKLALHTAYGAAAMAKESGTDVSELRKRVTSPGGTTQAALDVFEHGHLRELVMKAVHAATERGIDLAGNGGKG